MSDQPPLQTLADAARSSRALSTYITGLHLAARAVDRERGPVGAARRAAAALNAAAAERVPGGSRSPASR